MPDDPSGRFPIEDIAAYARGELADDNKKARIEGDEEAMHLVRQIQTDDEFLTRLAGAWSDAPDGSGRGAPPASDMVPGYRVLGELHRGGQGTVYRAIQERTKRTVALKVMHGGASASDKSRARFAREVELIASLRHPNIVTVFDGGDLPDGGCFVAMEFIRGVPLVKAEAFERRMDSEARSNNIRTKLKQFAQICDAVQYAHLRGIIHRDLKPGNILIDREGNPKVLDFGVAKVLGIADTPDATMTGEFVGTFAYAAPEQVSGGASDIDTRCDIYALGVVLYETLTGRFPYKISGPVSETIKNITDTDPTAPSKVVEWLDADIDAIVASAMAKSPDRRYQSCGSLGADIRRYLDGEPIEARRDSTAYLMAKLARRHRGPIALASVLVLALVGVSIWMSLLYVRAATAEREAERGLQSALMEADKRAAVIEMFTNIIEAIRPERGGLEAGGEPTIRDMLDNAANTVEARAIGRPDIVVAIQLAVGRSYLSLDLPREARTQAERAFEIASQLQPDSQQVADAEELLGWLDYEERGPAEAMTRFERVLELRESADPIDPALVAKAMLSLARVEDQLGNYDRSMELVDRGMGVLEQGNVEDLTQKVRLLNYKVSILFNRKQFELAEQIALTARELCEDQGDDIPELITPLNNLAMCKRISRDFEQAEELQLRAVQICRKYYETENKSHTRVAGLLRQLGLTRQDRELHVLAERDLAEAVEIYRDHAGKRPDLAKTLVPYAISQLRLGDYAGARDRAAEAAEIYGEGDEENYATRLQIGRALNIQGAALVELGSFAEAEQVLLEAHDAFGHVAQDKRRARAAAGEDLVCMSNLAKACDGQSKTEEADTWRTRYQVARDEGTANSAKSP
ncbi:MAG: tetratricopeptide repeat-containing serine/threonine protein kinase [Phycisphaerales bacterium]|nr:tetratricopeptide repeat-containing serine/threonine protein kinase [Phycisphaerales bacterium]